MEFGHGPDHECVPLDFGQTCDRQNADRFAGFQRAFAERKRVRIETDRQFVKPGSRTAQCFHLLPRIIAVHRHRVCRGEQLLIDPGALLSRNGGKIVTVKTYNQWRVPQLARETKAVPDRAEVRVQHIELSRPPAQRGQPEERRQARRLIAKFPAVQHLEGQPRDLPQAPEKLGHSSRHPQRIMNRTDGPDRHFKWRSFRRQLHERRSLQQPVFRNFRMDRWACFASCIGVNVHVVAQVDQPRDLSHDEGFRNNRKTPHEHRDTQRATHWPGSKLIDWKTSAKRHLAASAPRN